MAVLTGACDDAALLVLGAPGRWRRRPDVGRLLRRTPCAVAVVGCATVTPATCVVVGIDAARGTTDCTGRALATAAALADELDCARGVRVVASGLTPSARSRVIAVLRAAAPGCRTEVVDARGTVTDELLHVGDAAAVVAPRSLLRSPWRRSADRALLRRTDCPVLLT